jgi:threonine synthase
MASRLMCAGCGAEAGPPGLQPFPFRCAAAHQGDDIDHVMRRVLDPARVGVAADTDPHPFIRYRTRLHSWHVATGGGLLDEEYRGMVARLDAAIATVAGHGFAVTPFAPHQELGERLGFGPGGQLWIKDETGNVSGSHKARHLAGIMLYLQVIDRLGLQTSGELPLAIASCGNAALAAAIVARAARRPLHVFVPPSAAPVVLDRLRALGAEIVTCHREPGVPGDPCHLRFREFLQSGALPFSCQGSDNGLTIEGGATLGYEILDALNLTRLDRLFVQVGGGALASACVQIFMEARQLGRIARLPRIHAVQTEGGYPLKRAYDRVADRILARLAAVPPEGGRQAAPPGERATAILECASPAIIDEEMAYARRHRSQFMWPWETEPRSIATGILDDETYDWAAVVDGMLRTGGYPVVVGEQTLIEANRVARATTGINVDHTGSAGLAGLMDVLGRLPAVASETVAVIFSGVQRQPAAQP